MTNVSINTRRLAIILVALAAVALLALQPKVVSAQNIDIDRALYCFNLMLDDPAAYMDQCGDVSPSTDGKSLSDLMGPNADPPPSSDPCAGVGGGIGNTGSSYDPCSTPQSGYIAPMLAELFFI